jgi:LacI family transcriptional regulator
MGVTMRDVAAAAGTSVATVSAVLSGTGKSTIRVSPATRARIVHEAARLGFRPNLLARGLATRRTGVLGVLYPYLAAYYDLNPFNTQVMSGLVNGAAACGYNLALCTAGYSEGGEPDLTGLLDGRVDGLILVMPYRDWRSPARYARAGDPVVAITYADEPGGPLTVNADDFGAGQLAAQHLIRLGHRRIAHLRGDLRVSTSLPRWTGFRTALLAAGVPVQPELEIQSDFSEAAGRAAGLAILRMPRSRRPTAVFAANDLCAVGLIREFQHHGLRVPEDLAVVGCDDTWYTTLSEPHLTSVHIPLYSMGESAVRLLVARVTGGGAGECSVRLPVSLTVRRSCGAGCG